MISQECAFVSNAFAKDVTRKVVTMTAVTMMQPERDQICQRSVARDLNHAKAFPLTLSTD